MKTEKLSGPAVRRWPIPVALLAVVLGTLFFRSFLPGYVHFSNDGPLGQIKAGFVQLPEGITGIWDDLNYVGFNGGSFSPSPSVLLRWVLGPIWYSSLYTPIALFILGFGAWTFFNQLRLSRLAAVVGALAAALNSAYFSTACWGVASQQIAAGFDFMALALAVSIAPSTPTSVRWMRMILAGFAVGINVAEAADIGALYSMFVAAVVGYYAWIAQEDGVVQKISRVGERLALLAISAVFIAAFSLSSLIGTQIKGVAGTQQDEATKQAHWDFATQWSFPKRETLALIVPGVFGFRMDTPDGGNYWGVGGRDPAWWRYIENGRPGRPPAGFIRQAGGGCYMGITAVMLAAWAAYQSFQKKSVFTDLNRKMLWFWVASLVITLLLAYGRYAPFFQFVYALPYASTVRNPGKFLSLFTLSMTVLTAYGLHGLCRGFLEIPFSGLAAWGERLKSWWSNGPAADRRWIGGCLVFLGLGLLAWLTYWRAQPSLEQYLQTVQFNETEAQSIATFSVRQVGWAILFFSLGAGLMTLILSGGLAGKRAKLGGILLGILVVADLGRADLPWIRPINYLEKYADNAVLAKLRDKPYEHRVAILPFRSPQGYEDFDQVYRIEWAQHHFPFYDIQSLDIIQLPRIPEDLAAFEAALQFDNSTNMMYRVCRRWELTNTRYLLGPAGFLDILNQQIDAGRQRFRIAAAFDIVPKPGIDMPRRLEELTAVINPNGTGKYALFEFTGALPRVKLYSRWQVNTNDQAVLNTMGSATFHPEDYVLVDGGISAPANSSEAIPNAGKVDFASYAPKDIKLKTQSDTASVLLLNDKYDPSWQVRVDGQPAPLLRCNFLMRGVQVPAGSHRIEFIFKPDTGMLYVSVTAMVLALALLGVVLKQFSSAGVSN